MTRLFLVLLLAAGAASCSADGATAPLPEHCTTHAQTVWIHWADASGRIVDSSAARVTVTQCDSRRVP